MKGSFTVELYYEHAPKTCWNMAELARRGYYNNTIFHRIIKVRMGLVVGGNTVNNSVNNEHLALSGLHDPGRRPDGHGPRRRVRLRVRSSFQLDRGVVVAPVVAYASCNGSAKFEDEITKELKHTGAGVVSMVRPLSWTLGMFPCRL